MQKIKFCFLIFCLVQLSAFSLRAVPVPSATPDAQKSDEVAEAFADLRHFKNLPKFPGVSDADRRKFKENFLPEIKNIRISQDPVMNRQLAELAKKVFTVHRLLEQCETIIIESYLPTVFSWKLTFMTVTTGTLKILNDEEVIALLAHETGHLYYVEELRDARETGNNRLARVVELKADIVALETLDALRISRTNLLSALKKIVAARTGYGIESFTEMSPDLEARSQLIEEYGRRSAAGTLYVAPREKRN